MDKRAVQKELNTLACIPIGLIGYRTTIELMNDAYVTGKLIDADAMMNIELMNAEYVDGNGHTTFLKNFHVRGRKIRNVQIPDEVDVMKLIRSVVVKKPVSKKPMSIREKIIRKRDIQTLKRYHRNLEQSSQSGSSTSTASIAPDNKSTASKE
ncbi:UNVERIFIED_CONTAM: hypothetical protein RMT77_013835 [Armadillidium vulgare]